MSERETGRETETEAERGRRSGRRLHLRNQVKKPKLSTSLNM